MTSSVLTSWFLAQVPVHVLNPYRNACYLLENVELLFLRKICYAKHSFSFCSQQRSNSQTNELVNK